MAFTITKEMVKSASTYIPINTKHCLANAIAPFCTDSIDPSSLGNANTPGLYVENRKMRQKFMLGILMNLYLLQDYEVDLVHDPSDGTDKPLTFCMSDKDYDSFSESHIQNQLERLKKDKEISDKIFDIMADYKSLETIIYGKVKDLIEANNEVTYRTSAILKMAMSPENIAAIKKTVEELSKEKK